MTNKVDEALRALPDLRARVDADDDYLRGVIRRTEHVLGDLRPVSLYVPYSVLGSPRQIQLRQSRDARWYVAWQGEDGYSVALLSAPRDVRVEAFTSMLWDGHESPMAPIEALVIGVNRELSIAVTNRGPLMEVARRLEAVIEVAAGRLRDGEPPRAIAR